MIGLQQARPPFVEFKQLAKDDPKKSVELGYRVTRDEDFAFIMQPGSKDCLEINAKDWLESIRRKSLEGSHDAYPQEWVDGFHKKYDAWKSGQEPPLNGTSVKEWPILSPAQVQNFIALRVITIEDVAALTEEAIQRVGMDGRALREKAREWIQTAELSKLAMSENGMLKAELAELKAQLAQIIEAQNTPMIPPVAGIKKKLGRPPKLKAA